VLLLALTLLAAVGPVLVALDALLVAALDALACEAAAPPLAADADALLVLAPLAAAPPWPLAPMVRSEMPAISSHPPTTTNPKTASANAPLRRYTAHDDTMLAAAPRNAVMVPSRPMRSLTIAALGALLGLIGCGSCGSSSGSAPQPRRGDAPDAIGSQTIPALAGPRNRERVARLSDGSNGLGFALYGKLHGDGNFVLSPASIGLALGMTYAGAGSETAAQMKAVLHADSAAELANAAAELLRSWRTHQAEGLELSVANRIFVERTFTIAPAFAALTRERFGAAAVSLDFVGAPDPSRALINGWVEAQTKARIRELLPQKSIDPDTRLALVNAIYFKAAWLGAFEVGSTRPRTFYVRGVDPHDIATMRDVGSYPTAELDGARVLELAYRPASEVAGEGPPPRFAMGIVLPNQRDGLAELEAHLDVAAIRAATAKLSHTRVDVQLPKFTVDTAQPLALAEPLRALGMPLAFDRAHADFAAMGERPGKDERLFIASLFHKAFVAVDEKGTEAAAATAVVGATSASAREPPPPLPFVVDHPFLFYVRDAESGMLLFLGRVVDPRS
jgi:serpin B